jgi:hypothetical protein
MELKRGMLNDAQKLILCGPEGIGKSSLASKCPKPVFIDVEGSTSDIDVLRTPAPTSWRALVDQTTAFITDHHGCETLVVDTADWAEKLCISHICAANNMTSLGGEKDFGRSYNMLELEWCRWLDILSRVAAGGMHVVLTAHVGVKQCRPPDLDSAYDRYELKMEKKTSSATKEWSRNLLFLNYKTYVVEEKGKKRGTGGHRVIYTTRTPAWDAKNRAGLPDELRLDYSEIACLFKPVAQSSPAPVVTAPVVEQPAPVTPPSAVVTPPTSASFLIPLTDLMARDKVTTRELQLAVAKRGYYPVDTPLENYDPTFVAGRLVAYWPKVLEMIANVRKEIAV